jgi:hypothetical protein
MWRRILVLDLALVAVLIAGAIQVRGSWQAFEAKHRVESVQPEPEPLRALPAASSIAATPQDWTEISVNDPFSFDRNDVAIVAPTQAVTITAKPVLFGIMSIGSDKIAMLSPARGGRASRPVKIGETVDSWQVVQIDDKSVVVAAENGTRQTIVMNDPTAQVERSMLRTGTGVPSGPPVINTQTQTPVTPSPTGNTNAPAQTPQTNQSPAAPADDEYLVTPFGKVKRTKP